MSYVVWKSVWCDASFNGLNPKAFFFLIFSQGYDIGGSVLYTEQLSVYILNQTPQKATSFLVITRFSLGNEASNALWT